MSLQSTVNIQQGFGVVGAFYDDSPRRVSSMIMEATAAGISATIGNAFTVDATTKNKAVMGGDGGIFAGIFVNPKTQTHSGLDATLLVDDGVIGEMCTMGHIIVQPSNDVTVGMSAYYNDLTGILAGYTGVADVTDYTLIEGSKFVFVDSTASTGLAVVSLTNA